MSLTNVGDAGITIEVSIINDEPVIIILSDRKAGLTLFVNVEEYSGLRYLTARREISLFQSM